MKSHNIAPLYKIICLLALAIIANNAQAKKPKTAENVSSATLAETLAFIDRKLAAHFSANPGTADDGDNYKTVSAELRHNGDCQGINNLTTTRFEKTGRVMVITEEFSLSDMAPDRVETLSSPYGASTVLGTFGNKDKVKKIHTFYPQERTAEIESSLVIFKFTDIEIAERVAKAFKHAIKLCTGGYKKEPF